MLVQLKNWIKKLKPLRKKTIWDDYSTVNSYLKNQEDIKIKKINSFIKKNKPKIVADVGCNDGLYSFESLKAGADKVIGFDIDINVIDKAFNKSVENNANFLPLYFNAMNPSSNLGWNERERKSFSNRKNFDAVIALAFEHHLALGNNVPLDETIKWIMNFAPTGLIEYVDKKDETVKQMLSLKGDIFPNYNLKEFENIISLNGKILEKTVITETRILYEFKKN